MKGRMSIVVCRRLLTTVVPEMSSSASLVDPCGPGTHRCSAPAGPPAYRGGTQPRSEYTREDQLRLEVRLRALGPLDPEPVQVGPESTFSLVSGWFSVAEDRGFEPLRAFTQHAFQACALGHYANPPPQRLSPPARVRNRTERPPVAPPELRTGPRACSAVSDWRLRGLPVDSAQPLVWRHLAQLPQGRKAARVSELCRVREGSTHRG